MFCVRTGSVIDSWPKLYNCTGSIVAKRTSDRESRTGGLSFDDAGSDGITLLAFRGLEIFLPGARPHASRDGRILVS
jgi:hypothetical protein